MPKPTETNLPAVHPPLKLRRTALRSSSEGWAVVLVGRANVGKSALFNRLVEQKRALVSDVPHTTRDRHAAPVDWQGRSFQLVDAGGLDVDPNDPFSQDIRRQTLRTMEHADLLLFVVDSMVGITSADRLIGKTLRKDFKNVLTILVANKADNASKRRNAEQFIRLGFGEPRLVSAASGSGSGDLLDAIIMALSNVRAHSRVPRRDDTDTTAPIRIAIIGKPNVGKSSLINAILGEERRLVSPLPHTTRESEDIALTVDGQRYVLVDTAGLRRQAKVADNLEMATRHWAQDALRRSDIALLVIDASQPLASQDKELADTIAQANAGAVIVANKWDLIPAKTVRSVAAMEQEIRASLNALPWAAIVTTSATERQRTANLLRLVGQVQSERDRRITDNALSKFLKAVIAKHRPTGSQGVHHPRIYSLKQAGVRPPTFELRVKYQQSLNPAYQRFLERQLREKFGFAGTAIRLRLRPMRERP